MPKYSSTVSHLPGKEMIHNHAWLLLQLCWEVRLFWKRNAYTTTDLATATGPLCNHSWVCVLYSNSTQYQSIITRSTRYLSVLNSGP
jgi:hypothetical protein